LYRLTLYDAAYLELAQRLDLPLATLDADLRAAASALGVPLLGLDANFGAGLDQPPRVGGRGQNG
jgi:rRNA-processing protein FCF1